ncbi:superoxide dismutase family protein [Candidatus Gottesmanbacteria bacterium]|nr:superoxide dismutase family protein [Candidatus Gottesmanbacteria bacterium]
MQLFSFEGKETLRAKAQMEGDNISGTAEFIEYEFGDQKVVKINLELSGDSEKLKSGKHAVHIHEKGDCSCEGFKCAGGHFDPGPAGNSDPDLNHPFHAGDLPSITIDQNGKGKLEAISTRVTLSEGPLSILVGEGTALMVHANPDPYKGGEHGSGISGGPRIACGVIKKV